MKLRTLNHKVEVDGKVVLLRIDADVPVVKGRVEEGRSGRLFHASVGIEWLRQRGAKIVLIGHRGRPKGKRIPALRMAPVAKRLGSLLQTTIPVSKEITGPRVQKKIEKLADGDILLLENVRFMPGETKDDKVFAKKLAELGDLYVCDAFADSHRKHASVSALARELPSFAGLRLSHEVEVLSKVAKKPKKPFVVLLGGAKIHTKINTIEALLKLGARFCIGGALAHPFFLAKGFSVGKSLVHDEDTPLAKKLLGKYPNQIILPEDVVVVGAVRRRTKSRVIEPSEWQDKDIGVDVGPATIRRFGAEIAAAKTLVWNGPLGVCEIPDFSKGTSAIIKKMAAQHGKATTIVGGGDTVPVLEKYGKPERFTLVSTGGGAMMSLLAGEKLPALKPLLIK